MCAPTSRTPASASGALPTRNAIRLPCRTTKCAAARRERPAVGLVELGEAGRASSRRAISATAWNGRGRGVDERAQVVAEGELVGRGGVRRRHCRAAQPASAVAGGHVEPGLLPASDGWPATDQTVWGLGPRRE